MALVSAIGAVLMGVFTGCVLATRSRRQSPVDGNSIAQATIAEARLQATDILATAENKAQALADQYLEREDATLEMRVIDAKDTDERLSQRELTLEQRSTNLSQREQALSAREEEILEERGEVAKLKETARDSLERLAGFDVTAAKEELMANVEDEARLDAMRLVRNLEVRAREEAELRARRILATAIQRMSGGVVTEATVSSVELPSDGMKGRIIGREGRNIRAFEAVTGVNVVIDDTTDSVAVSCFDPVRREIARLTLVGLVEDGRIHPASIEQFYEKAQSQVEQSVRDAGEWALVDVGLSRMHPELVTLLGRLKYRTSFGQNVLNHSVEAAHVAGLLASELGMDPLKAQRAALLHDIGKAVTHEIGGSHALVGAEIARRFEEEASVVHAIEAHHNEVEPRTVLAVITQAADAVSAARPGARREQLDSYVKRLERLERIALGFDGVHHVFAMQAGREIRVVVDPGSIDDLEAASLAGKISRRLEEDLQYPGQIQVTVIREFRATEFAR